MLLPYEHIHVVNSHYENEVNFLLLASGSSIFTFDLENGKYLAQWRVGDSPESQIEQDGLEVDDDLSKGEYPVKRQKVARAETASDASSAEIVIDHREDSKRPLKKRAKDLPSVIQAHGSRDGRHVVVATDEDKCIRVLGLSKDGKLSTLSERNLPKKASAIAFSIDGQKVLCADKFGDVYGLPLNPKEIKNSEPSSSNPSEHPVAQSQESRLFKPAASSFTVHTKKNLNALKNQLAQSAKGEDTKKSRVTEYQPLLGHVSLLTDLLNVQIGTNENNRSYMLTADRDEHIRISRGIPQAHVIEGFCLGHSQFVSRLCVPSWHPTILISGGGDDYLISWNWLSTSVRQKIMIRPELDRLREASGSPQDASFTVSGIWAMQTDDGCGKLIVACEGVAALLTLDMDKEGTLSLSSTIILRSNVIDASVIASRKGIIYTLDNIREPFSTTSERLEPDTVQIGMHRWSNSRSAWEVVLDMPVSEMLTWASQQQQSSSSSASGKESGKTLYMLEHLRKQGGGDAIGPE